MQSRTMVCAWFPKVFRVRAVHAVPQADFRLSRGCALLNLCNHRNGPGRFGKTLPAKCDAPPGAGRRWSDPGRAHRQPAPEGCQMPNSAPLAAKEKAGLDGPAEGVEKDTSRRGPRASPLPHHAPLTAPLHVRKKRKGAAGRCPAPWPRVRWRPAPRASLVAEVKQLPPEGDPVGLGGP
jgi:hypothetical protein